MGQFSDLNSGLEFTGILFLRAGFSRWLLCPCFEFFLFWFFTDLSAILSSVFSALIAKFGFGSACMK